MLHTLAVCHSPWTRHRHTGHGRHNVCRGPVRPGAEKLRRRAALDTDQDPDSSSPRDDSAHRPEAGTGPLSGRRAGRSGDQPTAPVHRLNQRPQNRGRHTAPVGAPQLGIHGLVDELTSGDLIDDDHLTGRHTAPPPGMHCKPACGHPPGSPAPAILGPSARRAPTRRAAHPRTRGYVRSRNGSARLGHAKAPLLLAWEREPPRFAGATASRRLARHVTRRNHGVAPARATPFLCQDA